MRSLTKILRKVTPAAVLVVAGTLAACGGGYGGGGYTTSPGGTNTGGTNTGGTAGNSISVAYAYFDPSAVTISAGQTVTWVFSGLQHNIVFSGTGAPATISNTSTGSVSRTFNTKGTFTMTCTIHPGMTGTITVQ